MFQEGGTGPPLKERIFGLPKIILNFDDKLLLVKKKKLSLKFTYT